MLTLERSDIDALRTQLRGPLLLPNEPGYDDARSIWNAMIDRHPAAIVRCLGVADIIAGVNFAREHDLPLAIKGGGHNISGLAICNDGLVLDTSLMRGVFVNRDRKIAYAQPGCVLGDVDRETQLHGLVAVLGFVSMTGIAGLTLGGGMGYLTRRFGWTSDNVKSMEVVTADGSVVTASDKENKDLFWALRGGGGNFGVVTRFDYDLFPIGPEIYGGVIAWPAEQALEVLDMQRRFVEEAPAELTCVSLMRIAPAAPWLPKEIHGGPIVALSVCYSGSPAEGEKLVAPLKAFGRPAGDVIMRRSYVSQQSLLDATQPKGRRYYWKSEYLSELSPDLIAGVIQHASILRSPHSAIALFPIGGKLNTIDDDHSAVGNRNARIILNIAASWEKHDDDEVNVEWARAAWRDLRRFSTGGTYINFLTEEESGDRIHAAYGSNYDRLAELKGKWDPGNLFRQNKNIRPVTT
jgi:FAD/FMN-containing dehydrogenase